MINLTRLLSADMEVYPGDPSFSRHETATIPSEGFRLSELSMGAHNGTHIDAPAHYLTDGETVDHMPPDLMWGRAAAVVDASEVKTGVRRLILTGNSPVSPEMAREMLERGVRLIVVPGLSVGDDAVHRTLLTGGCWICENAACEGLKRGEYSLVCAPLPVCGGEAAPAVVLIGDAGEEVCL